MQYVKYTNFLIIIFGQKWEKSVIIEAYNEKYGQNQDVQTLAKKNEKENEKKEEWQKEWKEHLSCYLSTSITTQMHDGFIDRESQEN